MSDELIVNRVAESGLITLNLEDFATAEERVGFDIKPWLFREMILREKDFREKVKEEDWSRFQNKIVCFFCSADAIIPTWAYMLLATAVQPYALRSFFGTPGSAEIMLFHERMAMHDFSQYKDARVIVKGCGDTVVPVNAYLEITSALLPFAKSILYGEACSNVPVYKKK